MNSECKMIFFNKLRFVFNPKITKIVCQKDDPIQKGEIVVIMEAMKMEYILKSNCDGTLKSIEIKEGDQVVLDQILVQIEVEKKT